MKWLHSGFAALALSGCSDGPLPDANDMQAAEAIRECRVSAHWWFGTMYGFDQGSGVGIWLKGLEDDAFEEAKRCLRRSLRRRGVDSEVRNEDAPVPPEIAEDENGMRIDPSLPRFETPEPVWRDMNGLPVQPGS
jgi:hypothetical protein